MEKLSKKVYKSYLECDHFRGLNKMIFLWLIVFQIMQTMAFNALFDLPQLILILVSVAFWSYRKSFYVMYGLLTFFIAYYFQIALMIKLIIGVAMNVDFIKEYLLDNPNFTSSIVINVLFGDSKSMDSNNLLMRYSYQFSLLLCIYFAQIWKQTKWSMIRQL